MANAGTVQILVVGDTEPLVSSMKKGEKAVGSLNTAAGKLGVTLENINAPFEKLKKIFGARGPLKDLTELAVGGGAFAGISFLTATMERATGGAKDLVTQFRAGTKTSGELADEALRLIPIFGNVYAAGRNIREIFTGEEAALARVRAEAEQLDKTMAVVKKLGDGTKAVFADAIASARSFREETQRINIELGSGPGKDKQLIALDVSAAQSKKIEDLRKQLVDLTKEPKQQIEELRKALGKIADPINNIRSGKSKPMTSGPGAAFNGSGDATDYKERLDKVRARRKNIEIQIAQLQAQMEVSKATIGSGINQVNAAAADNLAAKLEKLAKAQRELNVQATNESMNAQFAKWTDKYNDALERSKSIIESIKTPAQKYADQMKELNDLLQRNMLTQDQFTRATAAAKLEMATSQLDLAQAGVKPAIELHFASAMDVGTGATNALAAKIAAEMGANVAGDVEKKQLTELQQLVKDLKELNRKLKIGSGN